MKKKAFTLAEILVALGAIGIIAAVTAPMLGSLMPDENKVKVLKYYKQLTEINNELINNPFYYHDFTIETPTYEEIYSGLASWDSNGEHFKGLLLKENNDINSYKKKYGSPSKYCYLLAENLERPNDEDSNYNIYMSFELIDGTVLTCSAIVKAENVVQNGEKELNVSYSLQFDVNGNDEPNKTVDRDTKKPDRFIFNVDQYGVVTGGDLLTKQYLKNPNKLNDKKADYEAAFTE